jgi:hypothetical protein
MRAGTSSYQAHDRRFRERWRSHPSMNNVVHLEIPDDVVVLDREPSPCFNCGARDGCRHRPWNFAR